MRTTGQRVRRFDARTWLVSPKPFRARVWKVARCGTLFDAVVGLRLMGIGDKVGCGIAVFEGNG